MVQTLQIINLMAYSNAVAWWIYLVRLCDSEDLQNLIRWEVSNILHKTYNPTPDIVDSMVLFHMDGTDSRGKRTMEVLPKTSLGEAQLIHQSGIVVLKHELCQSVKLSIRPTSPELDYSQVFMNLGQVDFYPLLGILQHND